MAPVATPMPKKSHPDPEPEYCTYSSVKVDDLIVQRLKIIAAKNRVTVQEYVSDHLNLIAADELGEPPLKRRPPPPRRKRPD